MLTNKYAGWYFAIVNQAAARTLDGYAENHHIIPKSMGGSDSADNIARLTAREHFICHRLLVKMTEGKDKGRMISALHYMIYGQAKWHDRYAKLSSRSFELIRIDVSKRASELGRLRRGVPLSPQACANIKASRTPEVRAKISAAQKGRAFPGDKAKLSASVSAAMTIEHRALLSQKAKERSPVSDETRAKMRASHKPMSQAVIDKLTVMNKERVLDDTARAKLSAANKGVKRKLTPEQIAKRTAAQKAARERRSLNDAHDVMLYFSEADLQQLR